MRVNAHVDLAAKISDAERLWYDTSRWPSFVDGFHHVVKAEGGWPRAGSLTWDSTPGGRGRVREVVERYEARVGQTARIEDERTLGTQAIEFQALGDGLVRMVLTLDWELKVHGRGPVAALVNAVFVRPRQREALIRTLTRFRHELADDHAA